LSIDRAVSNYLISSRTKGTAKYSPLLDGMISRHLISDKDKQDPILGICFKDSEGVSKMDSPS